MQKKISNFLFQLIMIIMGNSIYTLGVTMFILPNELITGGTTGLALSINRITNIPISSFVLFFNVTMFLLGLCVLGKKFALTTLISTFYYPFALEFFQRFPFLSDITDDLLLATIYAGLMIGAGIGLVIRCGASTGGMDIPPLVLNKKLGIPISVSLYVIDCAVLLSQMVYKDKERVLYGILLVIIYSFVLDKVLLLGNSKFQVKIISKKHDEIVDVILTKLDRGATLLKAETAYQHYDTKVILTVINNREYARLNELVLEIDPKAFMIVEQIREVKGRGFTLDRHYKEPFRFDNTDL